MRRARLQDPVFGLEMDPDFQNFPLRGLKRAPLRGVSVKACFACDGRAPFNGKRGAKRPFVDEGVFCKICSLIFRVKQKLIRCVTNSLYRGYF